MPLPDYSVKVVHPSSGALLAVFDGPSMYSLRYNRVLNGIGAVVLELPALAELPSLFPLDAFIEVERTHPVTGTLTRDETYFARLTHRFREGDEERFIAGGLSLNHLIARRIIDPDDDPAAASGFSTKAGAADAVLEAYAREQMGDLASAARRFPNLTISIATGAGRSVGARERLSSLLEVFQTLAKRGEVDFVIERVTGTALRLTIATIGADKTKTRNYPTQTFVMFNPLRGNLSNPSIEIDRREEGTFVYALGQGQGEARKVLKVAGDGVSDSPYNRIEFVADSRNIERADALGLLTFARSALLERAPKREFAFTAGGQEPGATYHLDWELGDKITAAWDGEELDLRITEVELAISEAGEAISVKAEQLEHGT